MNLIFSFWIELKKFLLYVLFKLFNRNYGEVEQFFLKNIGYFLMENNGWKKSLSARFMKLVSLFIEGVPIKGAIPIFLAVFSIFFFSFPLTKADDAVPSSPWTANIAEPCNSYS